jgi:hypothetical protein
VRQQIKWIAFAASFLGLVFVSAVFSSLIIFFFAPVTWERTADTPPFWLELLFYVMLLSIGGVPVAVGFAVLRYGLYNIDLLINRTLVYGALTATLALIYFGGVATVQAMFRTLTAQEQQPQLAVVVSTLSDRSALQPLETAYPSFHR